MSTTVFALIVIAFGAVLAIYFHIREKNYSERHPGEKNPITRWLRGTPPDDDDASRR